MAHLVVVVDDSSNSNHQHVPQVASLSRSAFNAFHLAINRLFPPRFRTTQQRVLSLVRLREIGVRAKVSWLGWSPAAFGEVCGVAWEAAGVRLGYEDEVYKVKLPEGGMTSTSSTSSSQGAMSSVSMRRV